MSLPVILWGNLIRMPVIKRRIWISKYIFKSYFFKAFMKIIECISLKRNKTPLWLYSALYSFLIQNNTLFFMQIFKNTYQYHSQQRPRLIHIICCNSLIRTSMSHLTLHIAMCLVLFNAICWQPLDRMTPGFFVSGEAGCSARHFMCLKETEILGAAGVQTYCVRRLPSSQNNLISLSLLISSKRLSAPLTNWAFPPPVWVWWASKGGSSPISG